MLARLEVSKHSSCGVLKVYHLHRLYFQVSCGGIGDTHGRSELRSLPNLVLSSKGFAEVLRAVEELRLKVRMKSALAQGNTLPPKDESLLRTQVMSTTTPARRHSLEAVDSSPEKIDTKDYAGNTPLYYACRNGRLEVVKSLLSVGAKVNTANNREHSPLHIGRTMTIQRW